MSDTNPMNEHQSDEDLLQWILDERVRRATPRAELERDPASKETLEDLERFIADCRASLADEQVSASTSELERDILAATTREDLRLRGDLRLVGSFVRQSLRSSMLLRVVAASLLLHIAALPVLAFISFLQPKAPETLVTFDGPRDPAALPYAAGVEEPEPIISEPELELDPVALPGAAKLFAQRLAQQGLPNLSEQGTVAPDVVLWGDPLGLVLWVEQQLDDSGANLGAEAPALDFALQHLSELLSLEDTSLRPVTRRLAMSAWLRAQQRGLVQGLGQEFQLDSSRLESGELLRGDAWAELYLEAVRTGE